MNLDAMAQWLYEHYLLFEARRFRDMDRNEPMSWEELYPDDQRFWIKAAGHLQNMIVRAAIEATQIARSDS